MDLKALALKCVYEDINEVGYPKPMAFFVKGEMYFKDYPKDVLSRQKEWLICYGKAAWEHGATQVYLFLAGRFHKADTGKPVPMDDERKAISIFEFNLSQAPDKITVAFSFIEYKKPGKQITVYPERYLEVGKDNTFVWFCEGYVSALRSSRES